MCYNIRDYSNPAKPHAQIICNFVICDVVTEQRLLAGLKHVKTIQNIYS